MSCPRSYWFDWLVGQHVNLYDPGHEYFAIATLTSRG